MENKFSIGDKQIFEYTVQQKDVAAFDSGTVHNVYATFALIRDAEWAGRLFVLEMKEENEEGIGTFVSIKHVSPALIGQAVVFEAELTEINGNEIVCNVEVKVGNRLIAVGSTGQKIIKKDKLERLFKDIDGKD